MHSKEGAHHITPPAVYLKTYAALLVLMLLTVGVAQVHLGPLNNAVATGIAVTKAVLVVLYFMQVRYSTRLVWVWSAIGFLWLLLLFGTMQDYLTRPWVPIHGW